MLSLRLLLRGFRLRARLIAGVLAATLASGSVAGSAGSVAAPGPPRAGPGSTSYAYSGLTHMEIGAGAEKISIIEPAGAEGRPLPVVVFVHGWGAISPRAYGAWIEHIVRRGAILLYPAYQSSLRDPPGGFAAAATTAIKAALVVLHAPGHAVPDLNHVALIGHSMGGVIVANLAAEAAAAGLPVPDAIMSVEPGKTWGLPERAQIILDDLSALPKDTLMLVVAGDRDRIVGDRDAKRIFISASGISKDNRNFIVLRSDEHGAPALEATHMAPVAPAAIPDGAASAIYRPDALDRYGLWKLFDGLTDAAFYGRNRAYALGNTPEQRFTGDVERRRAGQGVAGLHRRSVTRRATARA